MFSEQIITRGQASDTRNLIQADLLNKNLTVGELYSTSAFDKNCKKWEIYYTIDDVRQSESIKNPEKNSREIDASGILMAPSALWRNSKVTKTINETIRL